MAFVLQDVINEIEESRSLEPLERLKKIPYFCFDC